MSFFDFILSLLLIFNPGISEADFNNVYSVLDDTTIHSIVVDDSAFDNLSQLANAGVMPLDFTTQDSGRLQHIMEALYQNGSPSMTSVFDRLTEISNALGYRSTNSSLYTQLAGMTTFLDRYLVSIDGTNSSYFKLFKQLFDVGGYYMQNGNHMANSIDAVLERLGELPSSGGWDVSLPLAFFEPYSWSAVTSSLSPFLLLGNIRDLFLQSTWIAPGSAIMGVDGNISAVASSMSFQNFLATSFLGQRNYLVGDDRQTVFSFLSDDITQEPTIVEVDNMLDALGHIGTQLQNPLQRLAYVFANPQDLEIRDDVSQNVDQAQQDFFKPDGQGSVKPSQIGDAAGISGGAAGALASPGSVGDLTSQINNGDNFSFFSQTTLGNLDTVPAVYSVDDDFIDFYDPSNPALWEALNEPVS